VLTFAYLPAELFKEFYFMRSFLARLALVGLVGIALVGCGTSNGTTLPAGSIPNNSGGGPINTTVGVGNPPAGSIAPSGLLDDGALTALPGATAPGTFSGFNVVATDTQVLGGGPGADPAPAPTDAFVTAKGGFDSIAYSGNNNVVIQLKYNPVGRVNPSLVYTFGLPGNSAFFTYSQIVIHILGPTVGTLPQPASYNLELVGNGTAAGAGALTSTYDVRVACTAAPAIAPTAFKCGALPAYGAVANTAGPSPIAPGAAGGYTPYSYNLYLEPIYAVATNPALSATLQFAYAYAIQ
jgi:hypothetical protein